MKYLKDFNQYLANLAVMNIKLHNLHWNVQGPEFVQVHNYTEEIYNELFEYFDNVAEHLKKYDLMPDGRMKDYLENATIQEVESRRFSVPEIRDILEKDLQNLRTQATELRKVSDEEGWFSAVSMFEGHVDSYNKRIWFLKAMLG